MKALGAARSAGEVLEVVEDFLAGRSESYWEEIPEALREPALVTEEDLARWHHALVRAIADMESPAPPMKELCALSLRATVRVHQIRLQHTRGGSNETEFSARSPRPRP